VNTDHIYKAVKEVFDTTKPIYEEYIIYLIGFEGLYTLIENGLVESDGVINGRRSYILCDLKE
jgi:hypothetical protein